MESIADLSACAGGNHGNAVWGLEVGLTRRNAGERILRRISRLVLRIWSSAALAVARTPAACSWRPRASSAIGVTVRALQSAHRYALRCSTLGDAGHSFFDRNSCLFSRHAGAKFRLSPLTNSGGQAKQGRSRKEEPSRALLPSRRRREKSSRQALESRARRPRGTPSPSRRRPRLPPLLEPLPLTSSRSGDFAPARSAAPLSAARGAPGGPRPPRCPGCRLATGPRETTAARSGAPRPEHTRQAL